jgi:peptide-methionine (S)-S-oxide reductase
VIRTRVGYTGGTKAAPTYSSLGDHTESIQIDFDPKQVSFSRLLEIFWDAHNPTHRAWSRQYMSAIFYHDPQQQQLSLASQERQEQKIAGTIRTQILPLKTFYRAEDYHQKYTLRNRTDFFRPLAGIYPNVRDLVDSTSAARLNGYLGGHGSRAQLMREIDLLGLCPGNRTRLEAMVTEP